MIEIQKGWMAHFETQSESDIAITWRNSELKNTDWIVPVTDHTQHASYLTYRQALRDWPATDDFPNVRPEL